MVTHELDSIFTVADTAVFLDADSRTAVAWGPPAVLKETCEHPAVRAFLTRGG